MTVTETTAADLDALMASSAHAAEVWAIADGATRAVALDAIADAIDAAGDELVPIAQEETHLAEARLRGELKRTTFQLRLFARTVAEGAHLDARIDRADSDWPMGAPRPDLRRVLLPLGPVVIFAAGNFPFAFSVAGGDTASVLAAGCSVIMKAHPGHPRLSAATGQVVDSALASVGAPAGVFSMVFGFDAGRDALMDPRVKAGAFTGSIRGGRALFDLANSRPDPIPFYAEMGSVNPVFVTRAAAAARGQAIAESFVQSVTGSAGQLCTKPGLLFVPADSTIVEHLRGLDIPAATPMLDDRVGAGYLKALEQLESRPGVDRIAGETGQPAGEPVSALLTTTAENLLQDFDILTSECFGPSALVVTYREQSDLEAVAARLEGQLTAAIHGEAGDDVRTLLRILSGRAGRLLWNQWPTGVSVTYAQQHGGPYPATTAPGSTSVGTAALERFLRPVAYQGFPQEMLPAALRDDNPLNVPQRIDLGAAHSGT
ncbi:MAG: aldehyde dehydrogenase (NADP(+)) [Mycobacterium sp.]